jgi:hypothetical protein
VTSSILPIPELCHIESRFVAEHTQLPTEKARLLPMPRRTAHGLEAWFAYYDEWGPPGARVLGHPTHLLRLDAVGGDVLGFSQTNAAALGIDDRRRSVPPSAIPPGMTGLEYAKLERRLYDLSRDVWMAFGSDTSSPDAATLELLIEYVSIFERITADRLTPFYAGVAEPFFAYLRGAIGGRGAPCAP